ncbi:MAG: hypothetical protein AB7F86_01250 [Bdellovibrionales bacterium]
MEYLRSNIWEIKKSGALKSLGALLALFHLLQFYLWYDDGHLPLKFAQQDLPMCWSLMENCEWIKSIPFGVLQTAYYAYASLMVLAALIWLVSDFVAFGYYMMLIGLGCGMALYFQDLRLSSNEGYAIFLLSFAFLLVPSKHRVMRWLIVSFFAARGLSQASPDWLSGTWYREHMNIPIKLAEWLAALSLLVQMIGSATLLFRDGRYFWSGWILLFLFQCSQLYMGELLGASTGLGVLLYAMFDEFELRKQEREYIYQSFIRPEPSGVIGVCLLILFWTAQLVPYLPVQRGSTVKRILDVWALHPEAAHEDCRQRTFAQYKHRTEQIQVEPQIARQPAMLCNVYMRFLDLKALCNQMRADPEFITLASVLDIRSYRDRKSYRAFEARDFCSDGLTFKKINEVKWTTTKDM